MAAPSYTYTLANSTTADADEVMQNFNDILNGVSDGSKDLSISALTVAGAASFNGAVTLGNATGDDLTATGRWAADMDPKTAATYALGSSTLPWQSINVDNGATDGGAVYFGGTTTDFIKSDATTGGDLTMGGFTGFDLGANNKIKTFGTDALANGSFKTADYTVLDTDGLSLIQVDTSSGAVNITLPTASANTGRVITVKVVDATNVTTVLSDAVGETIDGVSGTTGILLSVQYDTLTVQCDGSDWHVLDHGYIGEYISDISADWDTHTLTSSAWKSIESITLTAGEWDISATATWLSVSPAVVTARHIGISTASDASTGATKLSLQLKDFTQIPVSSIGAMSLPRSRVTVAAGSTQTYYLTLYTVWTGGGTTKGGGYISATRVR